MKTVVLKFGGTSVGSIDRIKKVCKIISFYKKKKNKVAVVSSKGINMTLLELFKIVSKDFRKIVETFRSIQNAKDWATS